MAKTWIYHFFVSELKDFAGISVHMILIPSNLYFRDVTCKPRFLASRCYSLAED